MTDEDYCPTDDEVERAIKIGRYVARSWPSIDRNDVVAALYEWLMVNQKYVMRYRTEGTLGRNRLNKALQNHASRWCGLEYRKTGDGLASHNEPVYTADEIRAGLEIVCGQGDWAVETENGNMDSDILALLADVSAAYHSLSKMEREVLHLRYGLGLNFKLIANVLDITVELARGRHLRALNKMKLKLIGEGANWHRSPGLAADDDEEAYLAVR